MIRFINKYIFIAIALMFFNTIAYTQYKIDKIVIDAGHGGKDPGAVGYMSNEKDITLDVSLRLGRMIQDSTNGKIKVIYTRTTDVYPTLKERHALANSVDADLFVSIHVNATAKKNADVQGTETYVLGLHRMDQKEDAIANYEDVRGESSGLLDMNDPTTSIIITQYSQRFLSRSVSLANKIQKEFARKGREDKGVKQKGLEVLAGSAMPGVLVELGFINNREEEAYLNSEYGANEMAHALFKAIMDYAKVTP